MDLVELLTKLKQLASQVEGFDISKWIEKEVRFANLQAKVDSINSLMTDKTNKVGSPEQFLDLASAWLTQSSIGSQIDTQILEREFNRGVAAGKAMVVIPDMSEAILNSKNEGILLGRAEGYLSGKEDGMALGKAELDAKVAQARLDGMVLNDDEVAQAARDAGFQLGVASVVLPDIETIKKESFNEGVLSVDVQSQVNSAIETLKLENEKINTEANQKIDSLNLNLSLMLNEKEALQGQIATQQELMTQIQSSLDLMAKDNSSLSVQKTELQSLFDLKVLEVSDLIKKISELETKILELTKPIKTPVVESPVTEPVIETPVVEEKPVEPIIETPVTTDPVIKEKPAEPVVEEKPLDPVTEEPKTEDVV